MYVGRYVVMLVYYHCHQGKNLVEGESNYVFLISE